MPLPLDLESDGKLQLSSRMPSTSIPQLCWPLQYYQQPKALFSHIKADMMLKKGAAAVDETHVKASARAPSGPIPTGI